ncbi:all trans-polyprenyl-diphosphate synthase PDSS1 isoform X2 [Symphalangus syndactylus]|uniref:all trans-polyprenyl-diphosphate synthase PDSS1 isoform X2 n=1 Tax=Symphalangus syndactylus TaxID=9590 RepID=UPI003003D83E
MTAGVASPPAQLPGRGGDRRLAPGKVMLGVPDQVSASPCPVASRERPPSPLAADGKAPEVSAPTAGPHAGKSEPRARAWPKRFLCQVSGSGSWEEDRGPEAEPPPCRDFQTPTMASRWWRWRRGCSWRSAARSPGPSSPGLAGPPGPRAAADALAQIPYINVVKHLTSACPNVYSISRFHHTTPDSKTHSGEKYTDPFKLGWRDLKGLYEDIRKELLISTSELKEMSEYYFDGKGKAFRPIIVALMARACNIHHNNSRHVQASQRTIALIAEMIHTASLVHDDVIDDASSRRGKHTVNKIWGEKKAVLAGDLILSAASIALARIGNTTVISILTQVIEDLVRGEFLQLGSKENESERFAHYLEKTFKKTASLIANSCKAVSVLGCPDPVVHEIAYQYGKNVGIAFQLIDDVLDFTSCSDQMGKPTSADLKLGLATGPVLFACQQFPEMNAMIMRRFSLPGDVDRARQYVLQSDGVQQTTYLAQQYCHEAIREISKLRPSPERDALIQLSEIVLTRDK